MSETVIDLYSRAAGIDIHQSTAVASAIIPIENGSQCEFVRGEFDTFTEQGLKELGAFLVPLGVEIVLMESTGVYWMSAHDALVAAGLNVAIANAREIKGMKGRKTDKNDADWLARRQLPSVLRSTARLQSSALAFATRHQAQIHAQRGEEPAREAVQRSWIPA